MVLDTTLMDTYIHPTHDAFIMYGNSDDPIVNIPVPYKMPSALNSDGSCQLQKIEIDET